MTAHFTLVQTSKSYQVDKSQSTALASSHPFRHTNNIWVPFECSSSFGWSFLEMSSYKVWSTLHAVGTHKTHGTLLKATMEESQQAAAVFQLNCYTTPSVTLCISGLIPTISIVFIKLIRDLFWLFGSPTQANSSFPSFVERWYQISRHLDFQLNG